jgi:hypothetical protein
MPKREASARINLNDAILFFTAVQTDSCWRTGGADKLGVQMSVRLRCLPHTCPSPANSSPYEQHLPHDGSVRWQAPPLCGQRVSDH